MNPTERSCEINLSACATGLSDGSKNRYAPGRDPGPGRAPPVDGEVLVANTVAVRARMYANEIPAAATECHAIDDPWKELTSIPSFTADAWASTPRDSPPVTAASSTSSVAAAAIRDLMPRPGRHPPLP